MRSVPLFVGLDYHQDTIQVCVMDQTGRIEINRSSANDPQAVMALIGDRQSDVRAVGIEACCGAADFAEALIHQTGWNVSLAHAAYVAKLKGSPDKSDYSDARLLADLCRVGYLPRTWLPPAYLRDLRQLVNYRQRLVNQRRDLKLQIGAMLREQRAKITGCGRWSKPWIEQARHHAKLSDHMRWVIQQNLMEIEHLSQRIDNVEAHLHQATADDATLARLRTLEGIGPVTGWCLRAFVGRFERFGHAKQLGRYCGLSPRNASTGKRQADAGLIQAANLPLRAVLIQAAHRLIRTNERWGRLADHLLSQGKPKNVVVAAVANRWIRSVHARMVEPLTAAA